MRTQPRLNFLIVTTALPYPLISGAMIRNYEIIKYLDERHDVTLLTYFRPDERLAVEDLRHQLCGTVHAVPSQASVHVNRRTAQAASMLSSVSHQTRTYATPRLQAKLDELLTGGRPYDVVLIEQSHLGGLRLDKAGPALVVLDEHNIEYELFKRMSESEQSWVRRLFCREEYRKFRREEERVWQSVDAISITSEREAQIVREQVPGKAVMSVPNGVDTDRVRPTSEAPKPGSLVFVGIMSYRPNVDGIVYFAREVLPKVCARVPSAHLTIVGAGWSDEIASLAGPHVTITGFVPDVRPHIAQASAMVIPLRMGSGTRLKVLEGLAAGKPLVSTSIGCEGIAVRDGEHLLIGDDPETFAQQVVRVLNEPDLAQALSRGGRALVEEQYSWQRIVGGLEEFCLTRLADKRALRLQAGSGPKLAARFQTTTKEV